MKERRNQRGRWPRPVTVAGMIAIGGLIVLLSVVGGPIVAQWQERARATNTPSPAAAPSEPATASGRATGCD